MWYSPEKNETYTALHEIKRSYQNVLFPATIDDATLAFVAVYPLSYMMPECAGDETADPLSVEMVDGVWTQMWNVRPATQDELDARSPPAEPVPQQCAMWQARAILIEDDLLDEVIAALESIADEKARKIALAKLEYSSTVRRDDPLVTETIPALGKSEAEIDQMFIRAVRLA